MRLPRDLSGAQLARALGRLGYEVTRRSGSHVRLTTTVGGEHHVTIPDPPSLKVGTLSNILRSVAEHAGLSRDELLEKLFS
ncbi:MAG TPA: type II toxin-antitoxin system HicA family toxin [Phycisphaerae bacterium]|nr:type II toxin-antitoxin system HicA family toxin [Phycisphaerae bacterium]